MYPLYPSIPAVVRTFRALTFPAVAPVLLAATRAWEVALGQSVDDGWRWAQLPGVFAVIYLAVGILAFGPLLEES